jgi:hypothetical protein
MSDIAPAIFREFETNREARLGARAAGIEQPQTIGSARPRWPEPRPHRPTPEQQRHTSHL